MALASPLCLSKKLDAMAFSAWKALAAPLVLADDYAARFIREHLPDDAGAHRTFLWRPSSRQTLVEEWSSRTGYDQLTLTGNGLVKYRERFLSACSFSTYTDEATWFLNREGSYTACMPEWPAGGRAGAGAAHLHARLSDAEGVGAQAFSSREPATVALTGVDDAPADIHLCSCPMI